MPARDDYEIYSIPDFTLECGVTLRPARIAYKTYGTLNADKSNAIVYPELSTPHPLVRPLLGVGVLGGYTTFSTYNVDTLDLLQHGHTALTLAYFVGTPLVALAAVTGGMALTRAVGLALHRRRARP